MGIKSERVFSRLGLFLSIVALSALGPTGVHSTAEQISLPQEYVLKVSDVVSVSELVESLGGSVNHAMPALGYLGVELSKEQAKLVSRSALVSRITEGSAKLAGFWWQYNQPEIPEIDQAVDESVAGFWWQYNQPQIPEVEQAVDESVAGFWWQYNQPQIPEIEAIDDVRRTSVAGCWWHYAAPDAPQTSEVDEIEYGGIAELEAAGEVTVAGFYWQY